MTYEDTAATVLEYIGIVNSRDICECFDVGTLPVDVEMSARRFNARLTDGFTILGWVTEGSENNE